MLTKGFVLGLGLITCLGAPGSRKSDQPLPAKPRRIDSTVQILTPSGEKPISMRLVSLGGKRPVDGICVFYEKSSGLYLWFFQSMPKPNARATNSQERFRGVKVFVATNRIVFFSYQFIMQSSRKASSLDDAERKSRVEATAKLQNGDIALMAFRQPFNSGLLRDFTIGPRESWAITPSIIDVQQKNFQWLVTVQGKWKEIIKLDSNFQHISHIPAPGETPEYWSTN